MAFRLARLHLYGILSWAVTSNCKWSNDILLCKTKTVLNKYGEVWNPVWSHICQTVLSELSSRCFFNTLSEQQLIANHEINHYLLFCVWLSKTQHSTVNMKITAMLSSSFYQFPIVYQSFQYSVNSNHVSKRHNILYHHHYKSAQMRLWAIWWMQSKPLAAYIGSKIQCTIQCTLLGLLMQIVRARLSSQHLVDHRN